jgi:D-sedoheptulose 7-phosphate isomerase
MKNSHVDQLLDKYSSDLHRMLNVERPPNIDRLCEVLEACMHNRKQVFICGNGGSAGNANHIANDLIYLDGAEGKGLRIEALTANQSVMTCLGNDLGYEHIFSKQLEVKANADDLLIVLSGSGNSKNIIQALIKAEELGMKTCAILGYSGGSCKSLAEYPIHFPVNDMQVAEDLQMVVAHVCMKHLKQSAVDSSHG